MMKQNYLKSLFLMLMMCVGMGAWAEEETFTFSDVASELTWENGVAQTNVTLDNFTFTVNGGGNNGKYYTSDFTWRFYSGGGLSITPADGYIITGVTSNPSQSFTVSNGTATTSFSATVKFKSITIKYTATGGSTTDPTTTYNVTIASNITGGSIKANPASAVAGTKITLNATPNEGYEFGGWNVTGATVADASSTETTFTMPAANVNVSATFNELQEEGTETASFIFNTDEGLSALGIAKPATGKGTNLETNNYKSGAITMTATDGGTATRVWNSNGNTTLRVYTGSTGKEGTLTFSGATITKIVFNANVPMTASVGSLASGTWTGETESVTFTATSSVTINTIKVTYKEIDTPSEKTLSSIAISGTPNKTTYIVGDTFDPSGLTVTGTYSDNSTEVFTEGITWSTPATLTTGQTSVAITATVKGVTSAEYTVNGLTVNAIPEKTIAEFIASEGGKCYLTGTVSNITNTTFGNFDLTDESGTIYIYGCLNAAGEAQKFSTLGVVAGDKIKVLAEIYEVYNEKQEAKNVKFVEIVEKGTATQYTITISGIQNGTVTANPTSAAEGDVVTLTATPAEGYIFSEWNVTAGTEAITVENNKFTMPAANVTVSATFTEKPKTEAAIYVKKDIKDILSTDVIIVTMTNANGTYAISNDNGTSAAPTAVSVTVSDDKIESSDANILWNITYTDGNLTIYPNGDTKKWLYCTTSNNGVRVGTNDNKSFIIDGTYLKHSETSRYVGVYNNQDFRCYTSNGGNIADQTLAFYVKTSGNVTPDPEPTPVNGTLTFKATNEDGYWATFSYDKDVIFDASDVMVYTVAVDDNQIVMIEANDNSLSCVTDKTKDEGWVAGYYVQAGAAVLINSVDESVNYYFIDTDPFTSNDLNEVETDPEYNMLVPCTTTGIFKAEADGNKYYKLAYGDNTNKTKLGFWWGAEDGSGNFKVKAGGAVLCVPQTSGVKGFSFDMAKDEDAIKGVEQKTFDTVIYDMQGRKVSKTQKGLYIINGRKMVK